MPFVAHSLAVARGVAICGLALLLLLTPMCGALCHARSCRAPAHDSRTTGCHGSASAVLGASLNGTIDSVRNCNLEELPAVLPANFRAQSFWAASLESSGQSLAVAVFAYLVASHLTPRKAVRDNRTRNDGLRPGADAFSSLILRI